MPMVPGWSLPHLRNSQHPLTIDTERPVSIKAALPGYVHLLSLMAVVLYSFLLATHFFDLGKHSTQTPQKVDKLSYDTIARLESALARATGQLAGIETQLRIEQTSREELTKANAALVEQNQKLAEEQAAFLRLLPGRKTVDTNEELPSKFPPPQLGASAPSSPSGKVTLDDLVIRPAGGRGEYRYSFKVSLDGRHRGTPHRFTLQVAVRSRSGNAQALALAPVQNDLVELKNYRTIFGRFVTPNNLPTGEIEIRLLEDGQVVASQSKVV
ncbi:MAG: hypothetical protein IPH08_10845 [Rhodocyclaceae bacterium]|jgi:hypothetical protein|nr:hypothetical protein [Rhodocyclaceae bacterium]MBK6907542.1 hypothetical protein [Rhodocyclaceae bacterium]